MQSWWLCESPILLPRFSRLDYPMPVGFSRQSVLRMPMTCPNVCVAEEPDSQCGAGMRRKIRHPRVSLGFLLCFAMAAFAREGVPGSRDYVVDTWQAEDGLPQNSVTALAQARTDDRSNQRLTVFGAEDQVNQDLG